MPLLFKFFLIPTSFHIEDSWSYLMPEMHFALEEQHLLEGEQMKFAIVAMMMMSAPVAFANPGQGTTGHEAPKAATTTTTTTTTTTEAKAPTKVDCKDTKNKDKAECKKAAH